MPSCIVPHCTNSCTGRKNGKSKFYKNMEKHIKMTFHKLPKKENKRNIWLKSLQISQPVAKSGVVCSLHFNEQDFNRTLSRIFLRDDAVPSYYPLYGKDKENSEIQFDDSTHDVSCLSLSPTNIEPTEQYKNISHHNISMDTHFLQDNDISPGELILDEVTGNFVTKISVIKDESDVSLNSFTKENYNVKKLVTTQNTPVSPECNQRDKETNCDVLLNTFTKENCNVIKSETTQDTSMPPGWNQSDKETNSCLLVLLEEKRQQLQMQQKVLKNLKRKLIRREKMIANLKDIIKTKDKKQLLNKYQMDNLQHIGESNKDIVKRIISKNTGASTSRQYPPQLRSFALTLYSYSPSAYKYVQKKFSYLLPNPKTIYRWCRSEDDNPDDQMYELL